METQIEDGLPLFTCIINKQHKKNKTNNNKRREKTQYEIPEQWKLETIINVHPIRRRTNFSYPWINRNKKKKSAENRRKNKEKTRQQHVEEWKSEAFINIYRFPGLVSLTFQVVLSLMLHSAGGKHRKSTGRENFVSGGSSFVRPR